MGSSLEDLATIVTSWAGHDTPAFSQRLTRNQHEIQRVLSVNTTSHQLVVLGRRAQGMRVGQLARARQYAH
jgi:hypothetical protein